MAGRNILKAIPPHRFEQVLKELPPPPSPKIFKPTAPPLLHLRDRLPQPAPYISLEIGQFFITRDEFEIKVNQTGHDLQKIMDFAVFVRANKHKLTDRNLICGDIEIFSDFLLQFVVKEFISPRDLFKRLCSQFPFEFLLLFDLSRE